MSSKDARRVETLFLSGKLTPHNLLVVIAPPLKIRLNKIILCSIKIKIMKSGLGKVKIIEQD